MFCLEILHCKIPNLQAADFFFGGATFNLGLNIQYDCGDKGDLVR
jgi:hypothetical protein